MGMGRGRDGGEGNNKWPNLKAIYFLYTRAAMKRSRSRKKKKKTTSYIKFKTNRPSTHIPTFPPLLNKKREKSKQIKQRKEIIQ